ncbi:tyrosine-type recombinase/integrase [Geopseudomonas aromaticivorans]
MKNLIETITDEIEQGNCQELPEDVVNDGTDHAERMALSQFLARYQHSPHTLRRYSIELGRLWLWSKLHGKRISELSGAHLVAYENFLRDPQPRSDWCMPKRFKRHDPRWRPFTGPLSVSSIKHAFSAIQALMTVWLRSGYIERDPMATKVKTKAHMSGKSTIKPSTGMKEVGPLADACVEKREAPVPSKQRWFDEVMSGAINQALSSMPDGTRSQLAKKLHYALVVRLLTVSGVRISEIANCAQGNLRAERNGWWLTVIGKGGEARDIPLPTAFITDTLIPWRTFNRLPSLPIEGEDTPMLPPRLYRPGKEGVTERQALKIVKAVGAMAVAFLPPDAHRAAQLLPRASNHWFRHSFATSLIDADVPVKIIMETMGHNSERVLRIYDHKSEDARHDAVVAVSRNL